MCVETSSGRREAAPRKVGAVTDVGGFTPPSVVGATSHRLASSTKSASLGRRRRKRSSTVQRSSESSSDEEKISAALAWRSTRKSHAAATSTSWRAPCSAANRRSFVPAAGERATIPRGAVVFSFSFAAKKSGASATRLPSRATRRPSEPSTRRSRRRRGQSVGSASRSAPKNASLDASPKAGKAKAEESSSSCSSSQVMRWPRPKASPRGTSAATTRRRPTRSTPRQRRRPVHSADALRHAAGAARVPSPHGTQLTRSRRSQSSVRSSDQKKDPNSPRLFFFR
mmetsp:Transcript_456/g.1654  ORF Transcript_456/g.1654 Transcript_456/m.1654 type:complete len:284 (+) Transcript_456:847-1698(+)